MHNAAAEVGTMTNQLHRTVAAKIIRHIRANGLPEGHHMTEAALQREIGVSRGPIRAAMSQLEKDGVLTRIPNRGFFLHKPLGNEGDTIEIVGDEQVYLRIADDRLTGYLPEIVSETELMRRYDLGRERIRRILTRIAAEGWIERRDGRGWSFVQLIDSIEAYRESYELRQMIEPSGMQGDRFRLDAVVLDRLEAQQFHIRDGGWETMGQIELFEANSQFHEGLAAMSGNRFVLGVVERQNHLRRLVEYRQTLRREQVRQQNDDHLHILELLRQGDRRDAAAALYAHLGNAKRRKANTGIFANQ
ncbi:GntR family transcriptional regulator [Aureimonas altamirensis]|nr:GntR family transcriptional regulator [Aureimonas altamirensis]